jgi:DNA polymerase V
MRAIALVDANNFYCSCERVFNPKLWGKPVIVLSNNDGCIVSRSNESKALGIRMGVPVFQVEEIIREHGVFVLSSNYELYGDLSHRMMDLLEDASPEVERYSIDEAFIGLEARDYRGLEAIGRDICRQIKRQLGIPVSVGIAETKSLAKIAAHHAKTLPELNGIFNISGTPSLREAALRRTPIKEVWGIGRHWCELLAKHRFETAHDLTRADDQWVRANLSLTVLRLVHELRGIPCLAIDDNPPSKKCIASTRSFGEMVKSKEDIRAALGLFVTRSGEKLRQNGLAAGAITIFIKPNRERRTNSSPSGSATLAATLALAPMSNVTTELQEVAFRALDKIFVDGLWYKKAGVYLSDLRPAENLPQRLWENDRHERMRALMSWIDRVNNRFGRETIRCGIFKSDGRWQTRLTRRSPRYTTRWDELLQVEAK